MNQKEYRHKTHPELYRRSWTLTIIAFVLAAIVIAGIVTAWKYLAHDSFLIFAVILPASIVAIALIIAGLNGRRYAINDILHTLSAMLYFWN